jgi:hypothetical protein
MIKISGLSDSSCKLNGIWIECDYKQKVNILGVLTILNDLQEIEIDSRLKTYIKWIEDD